MTAFPFPDKSFPFTSDPAACRALDEAFGVKKPGSGGTWKLDATVQAALISVLAPAWDGLAFKRGFSFRSALLGQFCRVYINGHAGRELSADALSAVSGAIASCEPDGVKAGLSVQEAGEAFQKIINKTLAETRERFGAHGIGPVSPAGQPSKSAERASFLLSSLIQAASPERRARLARDLLPPWQARCEAAAFTALSVFTRAYSELFALGASTSDIFNFSPAPGESVSEQIEAALKAMPQSAFRALFLAQLERERLAADALSLSERSERAFEAKGLAPESLSALLTLVAALDEAAPGQGASEAISWLQAHPLLKARLALEAAKLSLKPSDKRRIGL